VSVIDSLGLTFSGTTISGTLGERAFHVLRSDCLGLDDLSVVDNQGHGLEIAEPPAAPCGPLRVSAAAPGSVALLGARDAPLEALVPLDLPAGVDATLTIARNGGDGVFVHDGAPEVWIDRALILDNQGAGLFIDTPGGDVVLTRSRVGVDPADEAHPNGVGVLASGAPADGAVRIGGPRAGNLISGNLAEGIRIEGLRAGVEGNFIGTDAAGARAVGNGAAGLSAEDGAGLRVGGADPLAGNLLSGNAVGVLLAGEGSGAPARVQGNLIGTDRAGRVALGNADAGVLVTACGKAPAGVELRDNVIAANGGGDPGAGVLISECRPDAPAIQLRSNRVGLGTGLAPPALGNTGDGIFLFDAAHVLIASNLVGANGGAGVHGHDADANVLSGNTISANGDDGVRLAAASSRNHVLLNTISDGPFAGIRVSELSIENALLQNSITRHTGAGITLASGGNANIAPPTVTYRASRTVEGVREWLAGGVVPPGTRNDSLVELYADADDEGEVLLGAAHVADGRFDLQGIVTPLDLAALELHATLTDALGNTSELGPYDPGFVPACPAPPAKEPEASAAFAGLVASVRGASILLHSVTGPTADVAVPAGAAEPDVCGDLLVYVDSSAGDAELVLLDTALGRSGALASDPAAQESAPAFSPDCARVAFISDRQGAPDLFVVALATGAVTALTADAVPDAAPGFLDPSTLLVSRRQDGDLQRELYQVPLAGGAPSRWRGWHGDDLRPRLSPDGALIAFASCTPDAPELCEVVIAEAGGGAIGPLRASGCLRRDPVWYRAADGSSYLLVTQRSASPRGQPVTDLDHVVLLNGAGTLLWSVTPLTEEDQAPACCLPE
jgi:parallel beta-helix repeat protein